MSDFLFFFIFLEISECKKREGYMIAARHKSLQFEFLPTLIHLHVFRYKSVLVSTDAKQAVQVSTI